MDINIIDECNYLSLAGKVNFPEVVMKLAAIGVERYIIDLVGRRGCYYSTESEVYIKDIDFDVSPVPQNFDTFRIKSAITNIQQSLINYQTFLRNITAAGCCHYEVFITGKKAIYFGRDGVCHIELFPQEK